MQDLFTFRFIVIGSNIVYCFKIECTTIFIIFQNHTFQLFYFSEILSLLPGGNNTDINLKPFYCPNCYRNYKYRRNLTEHIRLECGKEPQFACYLCSYRGKKKDHLRVHLKNKHSLWWRDQTMLKIVRVFVNILLLNLLFILTKIFYEVCTFI